MADFEVHLELSTHRSPAEQAELERQFWEMAAAAVSAHPENNTASESAQFADELLAQWLTRFGDSLLNAG
jgi:hypothetical protein